MAVAFRAKASTTGSDATAEGTIPTGTTTGDVMIAVVFHPDSGASRTGSPTGWTQVNLDPDAGDFSIEVWYKLWESGEAAPTWTWDAIGGWMVHIASYSGVDTTTPINTSIAESTLSSTSNSIALGDITPTVNDCMLVAIAAADAGGSGRTWTMSGSMTEQHDGQIATCWHVIADEALSGGSGTPVSRTATIAGTAQHLSGWLIALAPSTGGGGDATVNAVAATATTQAETPSVSSGSAVTSVVATATTQAEAPSVSAGSTVTAVTATSTAQAEAPSVAAGASVAAVEAAATAQAEVPAVSGGGVSSNVDAVAATATTQAETPSVSAGAMVTAVEATATAQAEAPTVDSGGTDVQVAAEVAAASSLAQTPGVSVVTYTLTLGTSNYPAGKDLLWGHVFYKPGTSIVKKSGVYTQKRFPNVDGAEIIYLGGRVYTIPLSEYDALTAAGFSSLLTATEVTY